MQIFIIYNPLYTALALDSRRFHSQIREAKIIVKWCEMIKAGNNRWVNQPLAQMYINNLEWLQAYIHVFEAIKENDIHKANIWNWYANDLKPSFHTEDYFEQMKRRLYTKDPKFYANWYYLGKSYDNWYYVNEQWKFYKQNQ